MRERGREENREGQRDIKSGEGEREREGERKNRERQRDYRGWEGRA